MKRNVYVLIILSLALIAVFFSSANADRQLPKQRPFSEKELNKFLNDIPEIPGMTAQGMMNIQQMQQGENLDEKAMQQNIEMGSDTIEKKGWDPNRFYYIYGNVMMVTALENLNKLTKEVAPQMAQAMKSIQNMQGLSKAQKKEMMKQMGGGMVEANAELKKMRAQVKENVPPSERRLIKSNYSEVCSALGLPENIGANMQGMGNAN